MWKNGVRNVENGASTMWKMGVGSVENVGRMCGKTPCVCLPDEHFI